jgi:hypothetical protein
VKNTKKTPNFRLLHNGYGINPTQTGHFSGILIPLTGSVSKGVNLEQVFQEIKDSPATTSKQHQFATNLGQESNNKSTMEETSDTNSAVRNLEEMFDENLEAKGDYAADMAAYRRNSMGMPVPPAYARGHGDGHRPGILANPGRSETGGNTKEFMESSPVKNGGVFDESLTQDGFTIMNYHANKAKLTTGHKAFHFGLQITRTLNGDARIDTLDLKNLFKLLGAIDPDAIIANHRNDPTTTKLITEAIKFKRMDYNGYMDIQYFSWGHPKDGKMRTTFMFWIHSNVIKYNLQELRQDSNFQEFLRMGQCQMTATRLNESRSRMIGFLSGKNPLHSNKRELEFRIENHLKQHSPQKKTIPVNVVPYTEQGLKILGFTVGSKDAKLVEDILDQHPLPRLEVIRQIWKRNDKETFEQRIKQHAMLCKQSTAFKLVNMDTIHTLPKLERAIMDSNADAYVVDICTAVHSLRTGTCYVQFLQPHRDAVLAVIEDFLANNQNPPESQMKGQPDLVNRASSIAPTVASAGASTTSKGTAIPASKYTGLFNLATTDFKDLLPTQGPAPVPATIRTRAKPKSFSKALISGESESDASSSDDDSVATRKTKNSGSTGSSATGSGKLSSLSKRSAEEQRLQEENEELRQSLQQLTQRLNNLESTHAAELISSQAKQQQQFADYIAAMQLKHKQEMEAMHQEYASQLRDRVTSLESQMTTLQITKEPEEFPSSSRKRQNQSSTPQKGLGAFVAQVGRMVAPLMDEAVGDVNSPMQSQIDSTEEMMQDTSSLLDEVGQRANV